MAVRSAGSLGRIGLLNMRMVLAGVEPSSAGAGAG
jgi:hypothetical protein